MSKSSAQRDANSIVLDDAFVARFSTTGERIVFFDFFFAPEYSNNSIACTVGAGLFGPAEFPMPAPARTPLFGGDRTAFFAIFFARKISHAIHPLNAAEQDYFACYLACYFTCFRLHRA